MVSNREENQQSISDQVEELSSDSEVLSDMEDMLGLVDPSPIPVIGIAAQLFNVNSV